MNETEFLKKYDSSKYLKPSVTVDINIFTKVDGQLKILLVKRKNHPFKNMYALPGGFANPNESLEQAAARELKEETNAKCSYLKQVHTFSTPNRDPRGWVITCAFMAYVNHESVLIQAGSDASRALWFDVEMKNHALILKYEDIELRPLLNDELEIISSEGIAFDHASIIAYALKRGQF